MSDKLIDIVIPAYNAVYTIDKTLMSIAIQNIVDKINVIIGFNGMINIMSDYIEIDTKRIFSSDLSISSETAPSNTGTHSFVKFLAYDGANQYGTIINSRLSLYCDIHIEDTINIIKSIVLDNSSVYSLISTSNTPIFRIRKNGVFYSNTNWTDTNSNDYYFYLHDGGTLFVNNVLSDQATWYAAHVQNVSSPSYNCIFGGVHIPAN